MYVDITNFVHEQEIYKNSVLEIQNSNYAEDILNIKLEEASMKYKNNIRKYLSVAINTINDIPYTFSLYKIGKDLDANFKVIESKIRKSKSELINEFNEIKSIIDSLNDKKRNLVNIAINIIIDYSDDLKEDKARENYINK